MKRQIIIGALLIIGLFTFSFIEKSGEKIRKKWNLSSIHDFKIKPEDTLRFIPAYKDLINTALAIDASKYKNKQAKAFYHFKGSTGNYTFKFTSLTETDGESSYKVLLDDKLILQFQNPETSVDYKPYTHAVSNIQIKKGQKIEVIFNSHSNGKIPENNAYAFSRGRWTGIELIRQ